MGSTRQPDPGGTGVVLGCLVALSVTAMGGALLLSEHVWGFPAAIVVLMIFSAFLGMVSGISRAVELAKQQKRGPYVPPSLG